jgi:uncharacterized protein YceH (UPF0502 family)
MFFIARGIIPVTSPTPSPVLDPVQARVVATLMEKARTVPDSYPMSLNSLVLGCNQKSSRDPIMQVSEDQVLQAIEALRALQLVRETSGSRVSRYEHNFQRGIGVPEQSAVLLGLMMLRGPQTAAELRLNAERWYRFADISSVEAFLDELQERSAEKGGPLVVKLPRAPGAREQRWMHLLCGPVDVSALAQSAARDPGGDTGGQAALQQRVATLEAEVARLSDTVQRLCTELGIAMPPQMSQPGQE